ncbi:hypothetical protein [Zunongwangia sp. H14]|uniref:hypothetical protein n=1 Tax=Zunongwangia sp. H14 TaxID=3240792 RepID=UPI0035645440
MMKKPAFLMLMLLFSIYGVTAKNVDLKNEKKMVKLELEHLLKGHTRYLEQAGEIDTGDKAIRHNLKFHINYRKTKTPLDPCKKNISCH